MTFMWISMVAMLLLGFPFMVTILGPLIAHISVNIPSLKMTVLVQQVLTGLTPPALVCVPMFILAASIITSGKAARKLIDMVRSFVGHIRGGLRFHPGYSGRYRGHHASHAPGSGVQ